MTTPLGAFARTPLGAFTTTPLGARGPAAVQPPVGLYTCTIVAQVGTATTDQIFFYGSSAEPNPGTNCGWNASFTVPGLGNNNLSEIRADSPLPIGNAPDFVDLFDLAATQFWRAWTITGDSSGASFRLDEANIEFSCSQREPIDPSNADTWWSAARSGGGGGVWSNGVPHISQTFRNVPGQTTGFGTWWNLLATPTLPYPFINGESGVISGVLPS